MFCKTFLLRLSVFLRAFRKNASGIFPPPETQNLNALRGAKLECLGKSLKRSKEDEATHTTSGALLLKPMRRKEGKNSWALFSCRREQTKENCVRRLATCASLGCAPSKQASNTMHFACAESRCFRQQLFCLSLGGSCKKKAQNVVQTGSLAD